LEFWEDTIIAYLVTGDLNFRSVNKFYKSL